MIELRAATARGDSTTAQAAVHGLKGASATIGASRVAAACAELETGAVAEREGLLGLAAELERAAPALREKAGTGFPDVTHSSDGIS